MSRHRPQRHFWRRRPILSVCLILGLWISVPLSLNFIEGSIGQTPSSAAILVLGGSAVREQFAANFAQDKPEIPIWVSSGSPREYAYTIFDRAGISRDRLHLDYRAMDTLTNFTTLVDDFQARKINQVYVITEEFHMLRAKSIGNLILGSRGIKLKPIAVPSEHKAERKQKIIRDTMRSLLWVFTGAAPTREN
jgi:uncharacterized SAM-binding protein YcdF (DUF218 family)